MPRVASTRFFFRKSVIAFVVVLAFALIGVWALDLLNLANSGSADHIETVSLDQALISAIRDGEITRVKQLLQQGASPNWRDEAGDTALMRAALFADEEMMHLLLDSGAEVRVRGQDGSTPLLRAIHDLEKMKLLLARGAQVDDFAMLAAASVPDSRKALELLVAHGGRCNSAVPVYTPLMAAAGNGDLDAVQYLLDHGADAKAKTPTGFTALIAAALSGNSKVVSAILERGTDPNAVSKLERGILQTPAGVAASMGHVECLRQLIAAGADVNIQGGPFRHTALLGAATTASTETVRLLLAKADLQATDWNGGTALDWAARRGETEIVKVLRDAGAQQSKMIKLEGPGERELALAHQPVTNSLKQAIATALPLLQESEQTITQTRNCVSCHQHPLVSMTVALARNRGFKVDETIAFEEREHILKDMSGRVRALLMGTGIDPTLSVHVLAGLASENEPPSRITDALVHYLVLRQRRDGRWQQENYRPPDEASDFQFTALAVHGLQVYASKGRRKEIDLRIDRARQWLRNTEPTDTTDKVFRLLGLVWAKADSESIAKAVKSIEIEQRADGGWAQLATLSSDAYATGLALYSLHEGGVRVEDAIYQRGVAFLLRTQLADGSWFVPTRSFPIVEFTKSGYPHGRSQFISASAACWATMALTLAMPSSPE